MPYIQIDRRTDRQTDGNGKINLAHYAEHVYTYIHLYILYREMLISKQYKLLCFCGKNEEIVLIINPELWYRYIFLVFHLLLPAIWSAIQFDGINVLFKVSILILVLSSEWILLELPTLFLDCHWWFGWWFLRKSTRLQEQWQSLHPLNSFRGGLH